MNEKVNEKEMKKSKNNTIERFGNFHLYNQTALTFQDKRNKMVKQNNIES